MTEGQRSFRREIRLFDATMIVVGVMVGSGIFLVSGDIARTVGGVGWLLAVWLFSGLVTLLAAACYGELAGLMPQAGGQYIYLREIFGRLAGFLYGWTLFMVIQTGSIAAVGMAFAKHLALPAPDLGEQHVVLVVGGLHVNAAQLVAIASIALLTWLNTLGLREGKLIQDGFTVAKVVALFGLVVAGLVIGRQADAIAANFRDIWAASRTAAGGDGLVIRETIGGLGLVMALGAASVGSLFACDAWNNVTFTSGETVDPQRTITRALVGGVAVVVVLYLLTNLAYVFALPIAGTPDAADAAGRGIQFATDDRVGTAAASIILGPAAAGVMAVLVMIATFGCNNGMILTGARVYYAMARDGLFFRQTGTLNARRVPAVALLLQGVWSCVLCLSGRFGDLLDYVIFAVLLSYAASVAGIFILRRRWPDAPRPWRAPGYPVLPALYVLVALAICVDLLIVKPRYTWPGLVIVALGVPVYWLWGRGGRGGPGSGDDR
ncbi:MAG TPA: amino acid permease [Candidatus Krumholzibacteria bacterium]|nr:amino acid permease [Candidatus Krumholzibacteria bacterium]HPD70359.1 amino acid permease [Candidatus Krumholzibacteria bacterium]HRY39941.1 amino acid permease [Candidatus Krumholzibacteria bacterium]